MMAKMTIKELEKIIKTNFSDGYFIDVRGMDFSGCCIILSNMTAQIIRNNDQKAEIIYNDGQKATVAINNNAQEAPRISDGYQTITKKEGK